MPKNPNRALERDHFLRRQALFHHLDYVISSVHDTSVDVLMNTVCVQDKTARLKGQGYPTSLQENGSGVNGRPTSIPYALGDFDALCVFTPGHRNVFLIPAAVVSVRGYLKTSTFRGGQAVNHVLYP